MQRVINLIHKRIGQLKKKRDHTCCGIDARLDELKRMLEEVREIHLRNESPVVAMEYRGAQEQILIRADGTLTSSGFPDAKSAKSCCDEYGWEFRIARLDDEQKPAAAN